MKRMLASLECPGADRIRRMGVVWVITRPKGARKKMLLLNMDQAP